MSAKKLKLVSDFETSIDFVNFNSVNNDLPILDIINERFLRNFRVSLSNHLHSLCNVNLTCTRLTLEEWQQENKSQSCMFQILVPILHSAIYLKFDQTLMNGIIDLLTGGNGKPNDVPTPRGITQIELKLMQTIATLAIDDLNIAWNPVFKINASYGRAEVNSKFVIYDHPATKLYSIKHKVEFAGTSGVFEVIYPYSCLFPLRELLFNKN